MLSEQAVFSVEFKYGGGLCISLPHPIHLPTSVHVSAGHVLLETNLSLFKEAISARHTSSMYLPSLISHKAGEERLGYDGFIQMSQPTPSMIEPFTLCKARRNPECIKTSNKVNPSPHFDVQRGGGGRG